jgi:hypothetical protein
VVWSGSGGWFLDPVAAEFELSEDSNSVRKYSLRFGDAHSGLGKYPNKPFSKDLYRPPPTDWSLVVIPGEGTSVANGNRRQTAIWPLDV